MQSCKGMMGAVMQLSYLRSLVAMGFFSAGMQDETLKEVSGRLAS